MKSLNRFALLLITWTAAAQTQLTIYNQGFAAVKERRTLTLNSGVNEVRLTDVTEHLEPASVVLRDLDSENALRIVEQNYESEPLSEGLLLMKSEGKTLDFEVPQNGAPKIVKARILRSGYVPHLNATQQFGPGYLANQVYYSNPQGGGQAIVEIDGKVHFGLPGRPIFDSLDPASFLKPTLLWRLAADRAGAHRTEISYLTGGMRWEATYDAVATDKGDTFDLIGWVTLENMSGKDFENASVKLMAGDVSRARQQDANAVIVTASASAGVAGPSVTEKAFDEYHLYTLSHPTTVLDREVKQVEFIRGERLPGQRFYVYDGLAYDSRFAYANNYGYRTQPDYGTLSNNKVWTMIEFRNSEAAKLGLPLPAGTVKLYRRDADGRDEFIGEDRIDHTPKDETARLRLGNAFDLTGERKQTNFSMSNTGGRQIADETFEIRVRNHKSEPVEVRVVEHLYRWSNWEIRSESMKYDKTDSRTIEFRPTIAANGEAVIHYTAHYEW